MQPLGPIWNPAVTPSTPRLANKKQFAMGLRENADKINLIARSQDLINQMDSNVKFLDIKIVGIGKDKIVATVEGEKHAEDVYVIAVGKRVENIRAEEKSSKELEEDLIKLGLPPDSIRIALSLKETDVEGLFTLKRAQCDLDKFLNKNKLDPNAALHFCIDMATGLAQLHSTDRIHDDMKLDNYLVSPDGKRIYLADLGKSAKVNPNTGKTKGAHQGNTRNADPTGKASKSNDVYGLGLSVIHVLEGMVSQPNETALLDSKSLAPRGDHIFADGSRRGIEQYMLNHKAFSHRMCETKNTGWQGIKTNIQCRARTALQHSSFRRQKDIAEREALTPYIDELCNRLESEKKFSPSQVADLKELLTQITDPNPAVRPTAEQVQTRLQVILTKETKTGKTEPTIDQGSIDQSA